MFQFEPKKEDELLDLLEIGDGDYEVIQADHKISKQSNPMIKLQLKVWDKNGKTAFIFDYLVLRSDKFSLRKIRHFCYSNGMQDFYEGGSFTAEHCLSRTGKLKIGIQKDETGKYPDKNIVSDYLIDKESGTLPAINREDIPLINDDIPF